MIYREQENYTAAVDTFRKMLTLGDENARSGYQEIIDTYREAKQWPQATATAKEASQKMPDDRDLRMVLDAATGRHGAVRQVCRRHSLDDQRRTGRPRCLCPSRHHLYAREAMERRGRGSRQSRATLHQGRRQGLRLLPARRPVPAPEDVRSGGSRNSRKSLPPRPQPIRRPPPLSIISAT